MDIDGSALVLTKSIRHKQMGRRHMDVDVDVIIDVDFDDDVDAEADADDV